MNLIQRQYNVLGFLLAYPDDEIPFDSDKETVETVCSLVNLKIANAHICSFLGGGLMTLANKENALRFKTHLESKYVLTQ